MVLMRRVLLVAAFIIVLLTTLVGLVAVIVTLRRHVALRMDLIGGPVALNLGKTAF